jgi:hypothetical protein
MRILCVLFSALALAGCLGTVEVAFDPNEAAFIHKQGKAEIEGEAFFRAETGRVVYAAGAWVHLIPATSYADARFRAIFGTEKYLPAARLFLMQDADPLYMQYLRATKADSGGRFSFEQVPPGRYYIWTTATWVPENWVIPAGGLVYEMVTISGHETRPVKVIVSGK